MSLLSAEVVIVGAGIAGCHLAQTLAAKGINTILIDQNPLDHAGPHWINGVPAWMFDEAALARPQHPEIFDINDRFILHGADQDAVVCIDNLGLLDVNMKHLGHRLKNLFLHHQGQFYRASINACHFDNGRLVEIEGFSSDAHAIRFKAKLFVDASGLKAVLRKAHPQAAKLWPVIKRHDLCTATQATFAIKDRHGALSFLERNNIKEGDILCNIGFQGGYSLLRLQINHSLECISFLCGINAQASSPHASPVISQLVKKHAWIGAKLTEGLGAIPINAPYRELGAPGMALLGDAAGHVYAAHGSGIGIGMIAARLLADAIIDARHNDQDIGEYRAVKPYTDVFHATYYRRLFLSEHIRRLAQSLNQSQITSLIKHKFLDPYLVRETLLQHEFKIPLESSISLLKASLKAPHLVLNLAPLGRAMLRSQWRKVVSV